MSNLKADIRRWFRDNPNGTAKECAAEIGIHQSTVYKYRVNRKKKKAAKGKAAEKRCRNNSRMGGTVISKCPKCGGALDIEVTENISLSTRYRYKKGSGIDVKDFAANIDVSKVNGNPDMRISRAICCKCGEVWLHGYDFIFDECGRFVSLKNNIRYEGR